SFLEKLREMNDVVLSIATGGWLESAELKLNSAGINIKNIPVASSNDHYCRTKIMKIAEQRATNGNAINNTYFGDGVWDKKACGELGYNFILVGNNASHSQRIINFSSQKKAFEYIGL
ncbi:MAG: HAD family hydrolase, partial [Candidatus Polarisedimenticolaceae bacterium]|nr:HAD family hydrolase [Candidatus Polarisedimenticolaceae bacterium]